MNITIEFSNPFQRFQVRNAMNNVLVLPDAAIVEVRNESRYTELMLDVDATFDTIDVIRVSGFTDKVEVAQFINSIPSAAFSRISRLMLS